MRSIHAFIHRITNVWAFAVLGIMAVSLVLTVNFADLPWTLPGFQRLTQGAGILDMELHYDADKAYRILDAQGETGRAYYLRSIWTLDIAIPLLVSLWLATGIGLALRRVNLSWRGLAYLNLLPLAAGITDLFENSGISLLLVHYPDRLDRIATATGCLTTLKHGLYTMSVITLLLFGLVALVTEKNSK